MSSTRLLIVYGFLAVLTCLGAGPTRRSSQHAQASMSTLTPQAGVRAGDEGQVVFARYGWHAAHAYHLAAPGQLAMSTRMMRSWRPFYGYPGVWPMGWQDTDRESHAHRYPPLLIVPVREHDVTPRVIQFDKDGNISSDSDK